MLQRDLQTRAADRRSRGILFRWCPAASGTQPQSLALEVQELLKRTTSMRPSSLEWFLPTKRRCHTTAAMTRSPSAGSWPARRRRSWRHCHGPVALQAGGHKPVRHSDGTHQSTGHDTVSLVHLSLMHAQLRFGRHKVAYALHMSCKLRLLTSAQTTLPFRSCLSCPHAMQAHRWGS